MPGILYYPHRLQPAGLSGPKRMSTKAHNFEWDKKARRRVPRFALQAPLDVIVQRLGAEESLPGRSVNISERGMAAVMAGDLVDGESVSVELLLPQETDPLRVQAVVRHQGALSYGFEFYGLSGAGKAKIRSYTKEANPEGQGTPADEPTVKADERPTRSEPKNLPAEESAFGDFKFEGNEAIPWMRANSWILLMIAGLLLAMAFWWRWNTGWQALESGLKNENRTTEQPQTRVAAEEMEKRVIHRVQPVYPAEARRTNLQAIVALDVIVGRDGSVVSVRPLNGPEILGRAAADALRWWKFQPYLENGEPIVVETTMAVEFKP